MSVCVIFYALDFGGPLLCVCVCANVISSLTINKTHVMCDYVAGLYQHSKWTRAGKRARTHVRFSVCLLLSTHSSIHSFVRSLCIDFDDLWTCFAITKLLSLSTARSAAFNLSYINNVNVIEMIVAFSSLLISFFASFLCRSNFPWSLSPASKIKLPLLRTVWYIYLLLARQRLNDIFSVYCAHTNKSSYNHDKIVISPAIGSFYGFVLQCAPCAKKMKKENVNSHT